MKALVIMALVSLGIAVSAEAQARCETRPSPVHAEVSLEGVRYGASAGGLVIEAPGAGIAQVKSACDGLAGTYLQAIAIDPRRRLTLAIRGKGIWSYSTKSEEHRKLVDDPRLRWPTAIVWQGDALWVGTVQDGLWRVTFSKKGPSLTQPVWRFRKHRVTGLALDQGGALLVGRDLGGLWRVGAQGRSRRLLKGSVQGVEVVASQVIVDQGAARCRLESKRRCLPLQEAQTKGSIPGRLPSAHITSLAVHPGPAGQPRLWVGTFDQGVVYRGADGLWRPIDAEGEPPRLVNTLSSDGERLWAATATGAYFLERGRWRRFGEQSGLPSDHVNAVHLSEGAVWFATSHGVARWDGARIRSWGSEDGLPYRIVYSVAVTGERVLAGTAYGLGIFEDGAWRALRMGTSGLSDDWVNAVAFRSDASPVLGTYDAGVDALGPEGISPVGGLDKVWVNPSGIFPVAELKGLFVATLGDGLWFWPDGGEAHRLIRPEGLPSQDVTSVQRFEGALWVGTRNGLARWSLDEALVP